MRAQLENQIAELKAGRTMKELKAQEPKTYYKVQGLTSKLSKIKAQEKGQFITKEHLVEYKSLIIWLLKNKTNYRGYMNLKESMQIMLDKVENEKLLYVTKKGIKGIVSNLAISAGLQNAEKNLIKDKGLDILRHNTYNTPILEDFHQFRLNALM